MARRTPKPFTVEVRKGGRQVKAAAASWPADPTMADDQPYVSWPELEAAPEPAIEAQEPPVEPDPTTGRVLLALDDPEPPMEVVEPQRRSRAFVTLAPAPLKAVEEPGEAIAIVSGAKAMANTLLLRHGRKRLLRSEFTRGEKWKARLPVAALKRDRRMRVKP